MCKKFLLILLGLLVVSSTVFAARFVPSKKVPVETVAMEEVMIPSSQVSEVPVKEDGQYVSNSEEIQTMTLEQSMGRLKNSKTVMKSEADAVAVIETSIDSLAKNVESYDKELEARDKTVDSLEHEVNRLHLGFGVGASYSMTSISDFGVSLLTSFRKKNVQLILSAEYPNVLNTIKTFDSKNLKYNVSILWEF